MPDAEDLNAAMVDAETSRIRCLYALIQAGDTGLAQRLEGRGFLFTDIRLTLRRDESAVPPCRKDDIQVRLAVEEDIPRLRTIASVSFTQTRFHEVSGLDRRRCNDFYPTWIENSCRGFEDAVLLAMLNDCPVGYITCNVTDGRVGRIGLFAVHPEAQGRGVGAALINASIRWFRDHDCGEIQVVTQGDNIKAQRLYQKAGFATYSVQLWFHRWFEERST